MTDTELLETVDDNLDIVGLDPYNEVQGSIAKTILRLPEEIREKAIDEVIYITTDGTYGYYGYYPNPIFKREVLHFITLNLASIEEEEEKQYIIAHEIAHLISGHYQGNMSEGQDIENEADTLCEKWGFTIPDRRGYVSKILK